MTERSTKTDPIECPRCGYDQRGIMATWKDACPLQTTCSECGLRIEWREVLNPLLSSPKWCVETRPPRIVTPRRIIATFLRTFWPWAFWSRLRMEHPVQDRRIAAYLVVLYVFLYLAFAVANGAVAMRSWQSTLTSINQRRNPPTTAGTPPLTIGIHAALLPFSNKSAGSVVVFRTTLNAPTPLEMQDYCWSAFHKGMAWMLFGQITCGLAFAALPISRRRAKVRWRHVFRVTAYGLALVLPAAFLGILDRGLNSPYWATPDSMGEIAIIMNRIASALLPLMVFLWWLIAIRRYLRMEHAWAVSLSVLFIGALAPLALVGMLYLLSWIDRPF
ncbi:MAG: hypothetical protein JSV91_06915 [Phycisphaerales bacterium]|nr:MAG: hypothetical protein JSV91_06915 [Phycisphaerales bacterium]